MDGPRVHHISTHYGFSASGNNDFNILQTGLFAISADNPCSLLGVPSKAKWGITTEPYYLMLTSKYTAMGHEDTEEYVKELDAWHDLIGRQREQLPELSEMLERTIRDRREADEEMLSNAAMLKKAIKSQSECMQRIRDELSLQMQFLSERSNGRKKGFRIKSVNSQAKLREEVRTVESRYFELKSSLMNYIWSVSWRL